MRPIPRSDISTENAATIYVQRLKTREKNMDQAIADVIQHRMPVSHAAIKYRIPIRTLYRRVKIARERKPSSQNDSSFVHDVMD